MKVHCQGCGTAFRLDEALVPPEVPGNRLVRGLVSGIDGDYLLLEDVEFL